MKTNLYKRNYFSFAVCLTIVALGVSSCEKDSNGIPSGKSSSNPTAIKIAPDSAAGGTVLTLTGTGLFGMQSVWFARAKDTVPASFNQNFNTDNNLVFRVPDTAYGGPQNIIFINSAGAKLIVPFKVIALPLVTSSSNFDFTAGTAVTLRGNNLDNVTSVVLHGTTDKATIISQTRKALVIQMPKTTVNRATLDVTNGSGTFITTDEFVNVDKVYSIFTEGLDNGLQDWSWNQTHDVSSTVSFMGSKSLRAVYASGSYAAISLHKDDPRINCSDYQYLTFWVKGGTADMSITVYCENGGSKKTVAVPANVWTYVKLPVTGFLNGVMLERLDIQSVGPNGGDQTLYYDNIFFVK